MALVIVKPSILKHPTKKITYSRWQLVAVAAVIYMLFNPIHTDTPTTQTIASPNPPTQQTPPAEAPVNETQTSQVAQSSTKPPVYEVVDMAHESRKDGVLTDYPSVMAAFDAHEKMDWDFSMESNGFISARALNEPWQHAKKEIIFYTTNGGDITREKLRLTSQTQSGYSHSKATKDQKAMTVFFLSQFHSNPTHLINQYETYLKNKGNAVTLSDQVYRSEGIQYTFSQESKNDRIRHIHIEKEVQ
jgi:hypothetical protein